MKLNSNCARDVLLKMEELSFNSPVKFDMFCELLPNYANQEINYCCIKLNEAGFVGATIKTYIRSSKQVTYLTSITYDGHRLLDEIRPKTKWESFKSNLQLILEKAELVQDVVLKFFTVFSS